ncbi:MAG: sensor histidine kinase [Planctomycetota bacterium]
MKTASKVSKLKFKELINAVIHEIKNPLSTIKMNLELIKEDMKDCLTPREKVNYRRSEIAIKEVERISSLMDDFLRFTLLNKLEKKETDINLILKDVADSLEIVAREKNIIIIRDFNVDIPRINCDGELLKRAIYNILLNAIQASYRNQTVVVSSRYSGNHIIIKITDSGIGVDENMKSFIFKPFFTTKPSGTGLGLSIAKRIIELHNGKIDFESLPGKGTTFTIEMANEFDRGKMG